MKDSREWRRIEREGCSFVFVLPPISEHVKEYDQSFFKEFLDMLSQNSGKNRLLHVKGGARQFTSTNVCKTVSKPEVQEKKEKVVVLRMCPRSPENMKLGSFTSYVQ